MSRYIDADKLKESMCGQCRSHCKGEDDWCAAIYDVMDAPTADVAEVVRCKDCRCSSDPGEGEIFCERFESVMPEKGFCSCGERLGEE